MKNALSLVLILVLAVCAKAHTFIANNDTSKIHSVVRKYPEFPGGESKFYQYIIQNQLPAGHFETSIFGNVGVTFVVKKNGRLAHIRITRSVCAACDKEAIRLLKLSPRWKPALRSGRPVRANYTTFVQLREDYYEPGEPADPIRIPSKIELDTMIFSAVKHEPEFVGGMEKFDEYVKKNFKYPPLALRDKIEGRVFVKFVVEKNGSLSNIKVIRGIGSGCDEEAIRLIKESPSWSPGMQNGRNVRVTYLIPITFTLPEKN